MMKFNNIKLFVFDLDDTLFPEEDFVISGFENVAKFISHNDNTLAKKIFLRMQELYHNKKRDIFQIILKEFGISESKYQIDELIKLYRTCSRNLSLYPDAEKILHKLKKHNKQIAILTDGFLEAQQAKVKALKLDSVADKIIYTDALGREFWKPSEKGFLILEKQFNTRSSENIYIADNAEKDFLAPNSLGWVTVKIERKTGIHSNKLPPSDKHAPNYIIDSLDKISL